MPTIREEIVKIRSAIREHRDQKGDDRCWLDDYRLWELLPDSPPKPTTLPSFEIMMQKCTAFYRDRQAPEPDQDPPDAVTDPQAWDADLRSMSDEDFGHELERLRTAIRKHRDIVNRDRSLDDDRELYSVLPEKLTADFRLPPERDFLGEAKAPKAGCPSFWRSHQSCVAKDHDMHRWGPCT